MLSQGSHRSGRADLPHPARQVTGSLRDDFIAYPLAQHLCVASSAIRASFVETVSGVGVPAIVPPHGSVTRQLLPSAGSLGPLSLLHRYYGPLRLLLALPAHLISLRGTADIAYAMPRRWEISQVPGEPSAPVPRSTTPVGPSCLAMRTTYGDGELLLPTTFVCGSQPPAGASFRPGSLSHRLAARWCCPRFA